MKSINKLQQNAKRLNDYANALKVARKAYVAVGVMNAGATSAIYGGPDVVQIAAWHEYGLGANPVRSFLKMPFQVKRAVIGSMIDRQFSAVFEKGRDIKKALGLIGVEAQNISLDAFNSEGFGYWPKVKYREGQTLTDTGTLKGSVMYEVRGAS